MAEVSISVDEEEWRTDGPARASGTAFKNGELLDTNELAKAASTCETVEGLVDLAGGLNGFYAIVLETEGQVVLATDQIRSTPLFYRSDSRIIVTDDDCNLDREIKRNELVVGEYALTGYATGSDTILNGVRQVEAGQVVSVNKEAATVETYRHTDYLPRSSTTSNKTRELLDRYDEIVEAACSRLIEYAEGRPIVVSLSAGYDARMVATMLSRLDYENTIGLVYRYGDPDEVTDAEEVAKALGIDSVVVTQDHDEFSSWYRSEDRQQFDEATQSIDALPTVGAVTAFRKAAENDFIPVNSVIVTGDSASTTGEHIPPALYERRSVGVDQLVTEILDSHYTFWEYDEDVESRLRERIQASIEADEESSRRELIREFERWDWRERQAKHILRNHVFDFYGFDWWLPLWDTEYMAFWDTVPVGERYERNLHETYVEKLFSEVSTNPSEAAVRAFQEPNGLVSKVGSVIDGTVLEKTAHDLHRKYVLSTDYEDNPVFGIMSRDQFNYLKAGVHTPHSFRALESLGKISFVPRDDSGYPKDGVITWDWCRK